MNRSGTSSSCGKDISYNKIKTSFNDPTISKRMRYSQYVRSYKYTYIPEACGDNTGLRVGYAPSRVVATILPETHEPNVYDMSYSAILKWLKPCFTGCTPITSYKIKSIPGDIIAIITPANPKPVIGGLQFGVRYVFEVMTMNIVGDSKPSIPSNSILQYNYPNKPYNIQGILGDSQIDLSWNVPFNGGSPIIYYNIYLDFLSPIVSNINAKKIVNLIPGKTYTTTITAVNPYGESYKSNPYTFIPITLPQSPGNFTASIDNASTTLQWTAPTNDGYTPIDFYRIRYLDVNGISNIQDISTNVLSTIIPDLTLGYLYTFSIISHNKMGYSITPTTVSVIPCIPPLSPSISIIYNTVNGVIIQWNRPLYDGNSPILSYTIYYTLNNITTSIVVSNTVNTYTIPGLSPGSYIFNIAATNIAGISPNSNPYLFTI